MDSELVSDSEFYGEGGGTPPSRSSTYTQYFERLFPFYLSLGMTYELYWDDDPWLVKAYRKAWELKQETVNQNLWLQGMYIYEALCCVAPIIRAFSKVKKPLPYRSEPYELKNEVSEVRKELRMQKNDDMAKSALEAFALRFNKRFQEKGGAMNGGQRGDTGS